MNHKLYFHNILYFFPHNLIQNLKVIGILGTSYGRKVRVVDFQVVKRKGSFTASHDIL